MKRSRSFRILAALCGLALILGLLPAASAAEPAPAAPTQLSQAQQALIAYAEAMLARGARAQYADTRLVPDDSVKLYRWQKETLSAEGYTSQFTGYTNCSNFAHDVYYFGLGYDIGYDAAVRRIPGGADAIKYSSNDKSIAADERSLVFFHKVTGQETEEEKAVLLAQFYADLQPADIIAYRYADKNSGHVMFYVGNDRIIHSTGGTYNYDTRVEKREPNGAVLEMDVHTLFEKGNYRYLFENQLQFAIIRPLAIWDGTVPQEAVDRLEHLQGVVAEKLCSRTVGQTILPGEELTYTIRLENKNNAPVTLAVKDAVPEHTSFVAGCDDVQGGALSWTVTVPAGETGEIAYTVRVKDDAAPGTKIPADKAAVGGVKCPCPAVCVGRHLDEEEKTAITRAAEQIAGSDLRGWALAGAVYDDVPGADLSVVSSVPAVFASLFARDALPGIFAVRAESPFLSCLAPTMYGGRSVVQSGVFDGARTRGPFLGQLEIGDIAIATDSLAATPAERECLLWMIAGEDQVLCLTGEAAALLTGDEAQAALDTLISYQRFAVLRPAALPDKAAIEADARAGAADVQSLPAELTGKGETTVIYQNDFESYDAGEDALWPVLLKGGELATNVTEKDSATVRYDIVQDGDDRVLQLFSAEKKTPWMKVDKPITGPYTVRFDFKFEENAALNQFLYLTLFQDSSIHAFAHLTPDGVRFQYKPLTTDQTSSAVNYPSKLFNSKLTKPGVWHTVKLARVDGGLYMKVWDKNQSEPEEWDIILQHEVLDASRPSCFRMQYYVSGAAKDLRNEDIRQTMQVDDLIITQQKETGASAASFDDVAAGVWYQDAVDYVYKNGVMSGYSADTFGPDNTLTRAMVVQVLYNKEGKPAGDGPVPFSDVPADQWYFNAVRWGAHRNVVAGYGGGVFKPDDAVTVEQVAVILHNYSGKPTAPEAGAADAGEHSDWAENALAWAVEQELFRGMPAFSATAPATRAQTAQILMNYLKK